MSQASREALSTSLHSFSEGIAASMHALHSSLKTIKNAEVTPYLQAIETRNGKTPNRLAMIQGRPAAEAVNEKAAELMVLCMQAQDTAMRVCETKNTNPGGLHFRRRKPAAARSKLSNQLKAIRIISNAAKAKAMTTKQQVTDLMDEMAAELPADVKEHWTATCDGGLSQGDQKEPPTTQESEASALLRAAARGKRREIGPCLMLA
jgi:hypothetical protein